MGLITKDRTDEETEESTDPNVFLDENGHEFRVIHSDEAGPESEGVLPVLLEGQRVQVIAGEHAGISGRMAYIVSQNFATNTDYTQFHTPGHPKRMFAKVDSYIVKTRDGRTDTFSVTPDEIRVLNSDNGWGRGSIN